MGIHMQAVGEPWKPRETREGSDITTAESPLSRVAHPVDLRKFEASPHGDML